MAAITIHTHKDIQKMRIVGRLSAKVLEMIAKYIHPGTTTETLDKICHKYIIDNNAIPAPLHYQGYPKSICTSVNHVVCHGIPNNTILKKGDIINIDVTLIKDGYYGDTSKMFYIGPPSSFAENLCIISQECMYKGISVVYPGTYIGDIGETIQKHAETNGFSVVKDYCGHGIGKVFHEEPKILNYGDAGTGMQLKEGMIFTIEPMINQGCSETRILNDGWTVITKDRKLSAQWEHTILVTSHGYEILTLRSNEIFPFS